MIPGLKVNIFFKKNGGISNLFWVRLPRVSPESKILVHLGKKYG